MPMASAHAFKVLICLLFGHENLPVTLELGKIVPEKVDALKCARCGRILVRPVFGG
jgi:hypothetical protein